MGRVFTRWRWMRYGSALRFAAVMGVLFGTTAGALMIKPTLHGALFGLASALVDTTLMMVLIGGVEIFLPPTRVGQWLARKPFLVSVALKSVLYLGVLLFVLGGRVGPRLVLLPVAPEIAAPIVAQAEAGFPRPVLVTVSALIVFLLVGLRQASQLVGDRTFRSIMFGRYHRPRREERFFLFVDIVGSTPVAERLGPLAVHRYLDRVFLAASDPIDEQRGEVYQYVGDELVATWTVAEGRVDARPLACLFAIEAALAREAPAFEREFGTVPRLRAALHAGETVTGEIGGSRRAIVFHGDVLNAASRLENLTRELGKPFLVSDDAIKRMEGTAAYALEALGERQLRGREAPVSVYAVTVSKRPEGM